jgi:two-component system CheB/CheR fusion protein
MPARRKEPKTKKKPSLKKIPSKDKEKPGQKENAFPVVGLEASAGGLEAFEKFFRNVPADSSMAFIVVTHLDPTHVSLMPGLIQKHTDMRVVQVVQCSAFRKKMETVKRGNGEREK